MKEFVVVVTVSDDGKVMSHDPNHDGNSRMNFNHDLLAQGWKISSVQQMTPITGDTSGGVRFASMLILQKEE